ncbi:MAG TPA: alpha-amylase family glycosyl hydrolase [Methylomirabilota bacterium]|nr:alpha-amylase family glycosyl hydrolase [Methylomirabilota bacterium]
MTSRQCLAAFAAVSLIASGCGTATPRTSPSTAAPSVHDSEPVAPSSPACSEPPAVARDLPWWGDRVFYEVFVRSFADSDGDGIGDLRGLTQRLDYLNDGNPATKDDLGVTGLWLMPIAESPSYHGYDVVDYRAIESDYGTAADFKALVAAANERGMAIVTDFVINHTSREHPWFQDARVPGSKHDDWYVWADKRPAVARSDGSRVWHPDGNRFYYGYFWEGMPDLNLENPDVTSELGSIGDFWLDEMGVDGFRIDAARHLIEDGGKLENTAATFEWLKAFRGRLKTTRPDALVLGEVWDASSMSSKYVRDGALDLTFDFGLASATILSLHSGDAGALVAAQREVAERYPPGGVATFLTNHDQDRTMSELDGDGAAARLAALLLLTGGGTPFIYYGEELGLTGRKPDERVRAPMPWDGSQPAAGFSDAEPWEILADDPPGTDVATETADPDSLLSTYRDLVSLRTAHPALASGEWIPVDAAAPEVVAYLRHVPRESVLVVANVGAASVSSPVLSLEDGPLCGSLTARALHGTGDAAAPVVGASGGFERYVPVPRLGPHEGLVIELAE